MSENKGIVIVTGSSRGIGLHTAIKFKNAGYEVIGCASSQQSIKEANDLKTEIDFQLVNMTEKSAIENFAKYIISRKKPIQCLVNNMGIYKPGDLETCNGLEELESLVRNNLFSAAYMFEFLKKQFISQRYGTVVNISSIAGLQPLQNSSLYCISKFAMQGYSLCLRQDMKKHNLRVITVMPGATYTHSWKGTQLPESRFIPPEDIADIVYQAVCSNIRTVVEEILVRPLQGDL